MVLEHIRTSKFDVQLACKKTGHVPMSSESGRKGKGKAAIATLPAPTVTGPVLTQYIKTIIDELLDKNLGRLVEKVEKLEGLCRQEHLRASGEGHALSKWESTVVKRMMELEDSLLTTMKEEIGKSVERVYQLNREHMVTEAADQASAMDKTGRRVTWRVRPFKDQDDKEYEHWTPYRVVRSHECAIRMIRNSFQILRTSLSSLQLDRERLTDKVNELQEEADTQGMVMLDMRKMLEETMKKAEAAEKHAATCVTKTVATEKRMCRIAVEIQQADVWMAAMERRMCKIEKGAA